MKKKIGRKEAKNIKKQLASMQALLEGDNVTEADMEAAEAALSAIQKKVV